MGLDVLAIRCHRHNLSHTRGTLCPKCELQESEKRAQAAELEHDKKLERDRERAELERHKVTDLVIGKRPGEQVLHDARSCECMACRDVRCWGRPPDEQPQHVRDALELARTDKRLLRLLGELHMRDAAVAGTLQRYPIPRTMLASTMTCTLQICLPEPAKLIRMELTCDEGREKLELTRVARVTIGTRTIAEGGSLAQLDGCPLAQLVMSPGMGAQLCIENLSAQKLTIGGVVVGHTAPRAALRAGPSYVDELEPYELARFNDR